MSTDSMIMTALLRSLLLYLSVQHACSFSIPRPLKGVIFDMDGTLIKSVIDFPDMRRRIYEVASEDLGIDVREGDVLALAKSLSVQGQEKANSVFRDIEAKAIRDMELNEGMLDLCEFLDKLRIPRALLTRNVEATVEHLHKSKMHATARFHPAISRDTVLKGEIIRPKPFPDAIIYICQQWGCEPSQVVMVGDSLHDDIVAANRAGSISVHLTTIHDNDSGTASASSDDEQVPDIVIQSLRELQEILQEVDVVTRKKTAVVDLL